MGRHSRRAHTSTRERVLRCARAHPAVSTAEIAARAGCRPSTVRKHLQGVARPVLTPGSRQARLDAARDPATPAGVVARLAADPDPGIRRAGADHLNCPPGRLACLAAAVTGPLGAHDMRAAVAANVNCPSRVLVSLHGAPAAIRGEVASNPNCPPSVLAGLAADRTETVSDAALRNPGCAAELLERLARLGQRLLRESERGSAGDRRGRRLCTGAAANLSLPTGMLAEFAEDPRPEVRGAAAANPNCPAVLLDRLAADPERGPRAAVAGNPSTSVAALERLARADGPDVDNELAHNPSTPPAVLGVLARSGDRIARLGVAANPGTELVVLSRLRKDEIREIRDQARRQALRRHNRRRPPRPASRP